MLLRFRIQMNEEPLVKTASKVFQDLCYQYRDQLTAGIIVAGWDRQNGGQVTEVSSLNSSLNYIYVCSGVLDSHWWNERAHALHDRRVGQHLHLRLRRCKLQEGNEQVGVYEVLHQWSVKINY